MTKQVSPDGLTSVEETSPGHFNVTCVRSGLPYTRADFKGMYCNGEPCLCELETAGLGDTPEKVMRNMGLGSILDSFK